MLSSLVYDSTLNLDFSAIGSWGFLFILAILVISLLLANILKKSIPFIRKSLIPTSVLGGIILLIISFTYTMIKGKDGSGNYSNLFNSDVFGGNGLNALYLITFHCLGLGFIASSFRTNEKKSDKKKRTGEVINTGITTVSSYLLQGILGLGFTLIVALIVPTFFKAAGILLPFGFGQGTGQALNYGTIYENGGLTASQIASGATPLYDSFTGGANFGLTIAALGFICSSIGGVIFLQFAKKRHPQISVVDEKYQAPEVNPDEISDNESVDKLSIQIGLILLAYVIAFGVMYGLSVAVPALKSILFGFNFIFGILAALLIKLIIKFFRKRNIMKKVYVSNHLMNRCSGFFFDIMILAGFASIQLELLADYWWVLLILAVLGTLGTYFYNFLIAKVLFKDYSDEQFLMMYGMLTGTASTGMMLLHEIDRDYKTPVADNLVLQNLPAIVLGIPMMIIATMAPKMPLITLGIIVAYFVVLNIVLFRKFIFKKRNKAPKEEVKEQQQ